MSEKVITLSQKEVQLLEAILIDEDEKEALKFLRDVVKGKPNPNQVHCGPKTV